MRPPRTPTRPFAALLGALLVMLPGCDSPGGVEGPMPGRPHFDGAPALASVERQVAFGPRIPGTPGHAAQLAWMRALLDSVADTVVADDFTHVSAVGDTLHLTNLVARFLPDRERRILLLTHWDTRPVSDQAKDPAQRKLPVPGANDGASGTAILLELARMLGEDPPPLGVDLLFVDGEDYGEGDMFLGSVRYADQLPPKGQGRPIYAVLLDMVGDADGRFPVDPTSVQAAPIVVQKVWRTARKLGYAKSFPEGVGPPVTDDHVPLLEAGLPAIDVIDFSYGPANAYWHTPEDTPDKVSAETLGMVGEVMAELIYSGG
ncbi:MAG: M28 family peptidase [Gemmatimonadota bacterium]